MKRLLLFSLYTLLFFLLAHPIVLAHTADLPSGFTNTVVAGGFNYPTALIPAGNDRIFVLEKGGKVKIIQNGTTLATPLLSLPVNNEGERGLLGLALDPGFSTNGYIYVYYINNSPLEAHLSRFTVSGNNAGNEVILMKSTQTLDVIHQSGTVRMGPDGKIWVSVGNNGNNSNSQDLSNIHGKIIRVNTDGSIPSDNPFVGQTGKEGRIWAYGFRNPFRFSFLGAKPIVGDVGQDSFEEIDIVEKGGNYGWPNAEGYCATCGYINPLFSYSHNGQSSSVTGGFYYPSAAAGQAGAFPAQYTNAYYYGDYARGFIRYISFDSNGNFVQDNTFDEEAGSVVDMFKGSDGSIYYVTIADGTFAPGTGMVQKISFGGSNQAPVVHIDATPKGGIAPLSVQFSSTGTMDPEAKSLTYSWEFGDGTAGATSPNPSHTYTQNGTYTATLTVSDGEKTALASVQIQVGNKPPTGAITSPSENSNYTAGQTITFTGTGTDPEDGELPASAYFWSVKLHHDTHVHPFHDVSGIKTGTFTIPTTGEPSPTTWYEISLTVTDSKGLKHTSNRMIYPHVVTMTFTSAPVPGLSIKIDGVPVQTPYTVKGVVGYKRIIDVPTPQKLGTKGYDYLSWSDNGAKAHEITTPATDTTFTASFTEFAQGAGHIRYRVREMDQNGVFTGKFLNGVTAKLTDPTGEDVIMTATSAPDPINNEDGWVWFSNVDSGTYALLTYAPSFKGAWKQTDCNGAGTTTGATIKNKNTQTYTSVYQTSVQVVPMQISYCKDAGLKQLPAQGNVTLKVWNITRNAQEGLGYGTTIGVNDVTVKLTDTTGKTVIKTAKTQNSPTGDPGWVAFEDVPVGTYGVMAYKTGFEGFWRQTDCNLSREINVSLQNEQTENMKAAWNPNVPVSTGTTTFCRDLGLREMTGDIKLRIREFDSTGSFTGKFLNGVTAKLTDPTGATVYETTTSKILNGQDGWVVFDGIDTGNYAVLAYSIDRLGYWKQTTCEGEGTTTGATIQNAHTQTALAGWQNTLKVKANTITWCADIGLKPTATGSIGFRVRNYENATPYAGSFINDATVKLTTPDGNTVIKQATSKTINGEDGWVFITDVPVASYGILTYKAGYEGAWKQTTCEGQGSTANVTLQNTNTAGLEAAWQQNVLVKENAITWCKDVALEKTDSPKYGSVYLRVREFDGNGVPTGKFLNNVTAKLTDTNTTSVYKTTTSSVQNGQDGWVHFETVPTGNYAVLAYTNGYDGFWKQITCEGAGNTTNASIQNSLTAGSIAGMQPTLTVKANTITWCADIGLKNKTAAPATGTIMFRVAEFDGNGNRTTAFINDAISKLIDQNTNNVIKSQNSASINTQDGWVVFSNVPVGTYSIYTYKSSRDGYWQQTTCEGAGSTTDVTVKNAQTDDILAVKQEAVSVTANTITWCKDVGLKTPTAQGSAQSAKTQEPAQIVATPTAIPTQVPLTVNQTLEASPSAK